ncbi:MAG TPA: hypothetical protein VK041_01470, partial [Opitutales bacterium]|nr:hypothetical protein [Opitutales bacterium]
SGNGPVSGTIYVDYAVATPVEVEGDERTAGIQYEGAHRLFYLAFPFEKIASENDRSDLMARVLDFFRFNRTPFENWQVEFFSENELDDPEVSGKLANPAGDGIPNLLKYALGLDPWVADRSGLPEVQIDAERLTLRYSRTKSATDLNYIVEVSEDLVTWENGEEEVEIVDVVDEGDTERVTVRDQKPFPESGRRFMRLRVVPID